MNTNGTRKGMVEPKFPLGKVGMTASLQQTIQDSDPEHWQTDLRWMLTRHAAGDWGEMSDGDRQLNDDSLENGGQLLSAYTSRKDIKVWVITEHDRSATTLLLPEDY
jgi:hypothetical protein